MRKNRGHALPAFEADEMSDLVERLQQSAHLTSDHNAAHALHAAVVEIRRLRAALDAPAGMIDDMRRFECERKCKARETNGPHE
jgi:hypothetical protein